MTGPIVEALGWALLHLLWQGTLVAGILAAALALLSRRSSNARYAVACGALALLPLLATITAVRSYEAPAQLDVATGFSPSHSGLKPAATFTLEDPTPVPASFSATARQYLPFVVIAWLAGVVLLATRLIVSWTRVQRMARDRARSAAAAWTACVDRLSRRLELRRAVRLLESVAVEVPTVIGWLRPVVLLPASTLAGLSPEQIEMLLAHELAHIKRHDFFINLLQALVETLMFYHPAVWWISRRVRIERENCCDDLAIQVCGDRVQYARALTRLEELRADVRYGAVAANGGSLMARIRRLLVAPREATGTASRWAAGAAVLAAIIAVITLPSLPMFANREDKQPPKPPAAEVEVTAEAPVPPVPPVPSPHPMPAPRAIAIVAPHIAQAIAQGIEGGIEGGIDTDDEADMKKFGASGKLTVDELITLRSNDVTPEYIDQMRSASLGALTLGQILAMKVQGVTPKYVKDLRDAGVDVKNAREIVMLASQDVTPEYIAQMRSAGYGNLSVRDLIELKSQDVTPEYVQQMASAGYRNLKPRELMELKSQDVTPAFIKALADAGYTNLTVREIVRLAASGVNADFIREISKYRDQKNK